MNVPFFGCQSRAHALLLLTSVESLDKINDTQFPLRFREQSAEVAGGGSSHSSRNRLPLNQHGMPMSKYCYECGSKYPVPQAKYCCECGTQRI